MSFYPGLNIITGETGSGKSMLMDALGFVTGRRLATAQYHIQGQRTCVEAEFVLPSGHPALNVLNNLEIELMETAPGNILLRRDITPSGSSRATVNGQVATIEDVRMLSQSLLDIHSQHANLLLSRNDFQLSALDAVAESKPLLDQYRKVWGQYRKSLDEFRTTKETLQAEESQRELLDYHLQQILNLNLKPGEQNDLEAQQKMLESATDIKLRTTSALQALEGEGQVDGILKSLAKAKDSLNRVLEILPQASELSNRIENLRIESLDVIETLVQLDSKITGDPNLLEQITERLSDIYTLLHRHSLQNSDELIEMANRLNQRLDRLDDSSALLSDLEAKAKHLKKQAVLLSRKLTEIRTKAAIRLQQEIMDNSRPLALENLRCMIKITPSKLGPSGGDDIEFLFAFNKNQELMPVGKTASGGEISRVMLVLKSILARKGFLPTVVLDEIDTGISGQVANLMGRHIGEIAQTTQVIAITHLPQVAAMGNTHIKVSKTDVGNETVTSIRALSHDERIKEITTMIAGNPSEASANEIAVKMLEKSSN